jgi:hypothetical protein
MKPAKITYRERSGVALVETAILCLFLYVPVLMMVIVWGDLTLDKERSHAAGAYMAFSTNRIEENELVENFFPGMTGVSDPTHSIRNVHLLRDDIDRLRYTLPGSRQGDYSGTAAEHEYDLQYKLFSLGIGEFHMRHELVTTPDGRLEFVSRWEHSDDYISRYLTTNGIVNPGLPPATEGNILPAQTASIDTWADSQAYTAYVETLNELFNGALSDYSDPAFISISSFETQFRSPYLTRLKESNDEYGIGDIEQLLLPEIITMRFSPRSASGSHPEDSSFWTGFTYLGNRDARLVKAENVRQMLHQVTQSGRFIETKTMFIDEGQPGTRIGDMPPAFSGNMESDSVYLTPGDPTSE